MFRNNWNWRCGNDAPTGNYYTMRSIHKKTWLTTVFDKHFRPQSSTLRDHQCVPYVAKFKIKRHWLVENHEQGSSGLKWNARCINIIIILSFSKVYKPVSWASWGICSIQIKIIVRPTEINSEPKISPRYPYRNKLEKFNTSTTNTISDEQALATCALN